MESTLRSVRGLAIAGAVAAVLGQAGVAQAQGSYPVKPVRTVVAFAAGGFADTVARLVGQKLSERLGQPVLVENRGGAGGNIAARQVASAAPDGYTLLVHTAAISINPSLYKNPGFDLTNDLLPVANTGSTPGLFAVHSSNNATSLQDLIKAYKGKRLTFSTAGVGTSSHLAGEYLFKVLAGLDAVHVPFQGGAPAITAVVSNQVDVISGSMPPVAPFVRKGTLKALGVSSLQRVNGLPDVPTVSEAGFKDFEERSWVGYFAPARTGGDIVQRVNADINQILALPDIKDRFTALGMDAHPGSPAEFAAYVRKEAAKWATVIKTTRIPQVE
jgi:tripartite-type tricarboxylate transporter receptor subunit TctC